MKRFVIDGNFQRKTLWKACVDTCDRDTAAPSHTVQGVVHRGCSVIAIHSGNWHYVKGQTMRLKTNKVLLEFMQSPHEEIIKSVWEKTQSSILSVMTVADLWNTEDVYTDFALTVFKLGLVILFRSIYCHICRKPLNSLMTIKISNGLQKKEENLTVCSYSKAVIRPSNHFKQL